MYELHVTTLEQSDVMGIRLRRKGFEIIDTVAIQLPKGELYGFLTRHMESDTIAEEAIRSGARALLDIDAGRIDSSGDHKRPYQPTNEDRNVYGEQDGFEPTNADGRFPTNTIFVHTPGCEYKGTKTVKNTSGSVEGTEPSSKTKSTYGEYEERRNWDAYGDEEGNEEVGDWDCVEGCKVRRLDQQSGKSSSPQTYRRSTSGKNATTYGKNMGEGEGVISKNYGDEGGASRFYFQAESPEEAAQYLTQLIDSVELPSSDKEREKPPFFYTSKASRGERDRGCGDLYWKWTGEDWMEITEEEFEAHKESEDSPRTKNGNPHPTLKPTDLMQWLVGKLTDSDDRILDPFAGTGSTAIAALKEHRDCHLVELNETGNYEKVLHGRLEAAKRAVIEKTPVWEEPPEIELGWKTDEQEFEDFTTHWGS